MAEQRKLGIFSILLLFAGGALFCYVTLDLMRPTQEPMEPGFHDVSAFGESDVSKIDMWLDKQFKQSHFPSLNVAIVREGEIVYHRAFGYENTWMRRKATTESAYHVASVTKSFVASLAVLLHHQNVIDLDQPVLNYFPENIRLSTQPDVGATITLRHLASHTSGLPRSLSYPVQQVEGFYHLQPKMLFEQLPDLVLDFSPGENEQYSNIGFGLLGHALERASGKSLNDLLQFYLCEPLGLKGTAIHIDDELQIAQGYTTPPQLPESHSYLKRLAGSGGLVSTTGDLARFLIEHMNPELFTQDMLDELHAESTLLDGDPSGRALGWSIEKRNPSGKIFSKNGRRGNTSAWMGFIPEQSVGVAVIANIGKPQVDSIGRWLLERSVPGGHQPASQFGYAKVAPYTGVRWENNRPIVQIGSQWYPIVTIDEIPIDDIMIFADQTYRSIARKRFSEDLPELLAAMGHVPNWEVTLGLQVSSDEVKNLKIRMTEYNRKKVRNQ